MTFPINQHKPQVIGKKKITTKISSNLNPPYLTPEYAKNVWKIRFHQTNLSSFPLENCFAILLKSFFIFTPSLPELQDFFIFKNYKNKKIRGFEILLFTQ